MQGTTRYNQELVDQFWAQAVQTSDVFKTGIASILPKWNEAVEKCEGIPAIPSARDMVAKMAQMATVLKEAADTGDKDNRNYQAEMESQVVNQGIRM